MTDSQEDTGGSSGRRARRAPRRITPAYLDNCAKFYLERYASSAENLRRVLYRRVWKSCAHHGTDAAEARAWVDELVARYARAGLVDDGLYAGGRARALFRQGVPPAMIRRRLQAKGVGEAEIAGALAQLADDVADPDFAAAVAYARRRRLGPWSRPDGRAARREKDLAAMARAGFGYDVARRVIDAADEDAALAEPGAAILLGGRRGWL
jgi:regulatory protein